MSFLKRLFGASPSSPPAPELAAAEEYKGFLIRAAPIAEGGQFRLAAEISMARDGETRTHRMIRADVFPSRDGAIEAAVRKAKLLIDQQGEAIF